MKTVQEFFDATLIRPHHARPKIWCVDGFCISVQAGPYLYCEPEDLVSGPFSKVECEYPSPEYPVILEPYHDGEGIYQYVPIELVDELLQSHGGIDVDKTMGKR